MKVPDRQLVGKAGIPLFLPPFEDSAGQSRYRYQIIEGLRLARQYDAGVAELRARAEVQPADQDVHETVSNLYWQKKMYAESVRELAKTYAPQSAAELEEAFRLGGTQRAAEWRLAHTKKLQAQMYVSPFGLAFAAARAGHKEETLRYLEQSCEEHVP